MSRKPTLKSNFSDLFEDNLLDEEGSAATLRISEIEPNKNQPRKNFDLDALKALAESIKDNGVLQPLLVRSMPDGHYQIVAGERRWRAAKIAGLTEVPVLIRELSEEETMKIALIENLQRENLNPIEEAQGYKDLIESYNMKQDDVAKTVGKSRPAVTNSLRLLSLPQAVRELLRDGEITVGHCKALMAINDEATMIELALRAADGELTVRSIEKLAKRLEKKDEEEKEIKQRDRYFVEVEASLSDVLSTKVRVVEGKKKNTLEIDFTDNDQLSQLVKLLGNV